MLYKHQLKIIRDDPKKCGLWLGTGSGKTLTALSLARGNTLVICPKTQKEDRNWEREVEKNKLNIKLTTISKETFRRDWEKLPKFDTVIIDECHTALGVTPNIRYRKKVAIPKASQIFEAIESYLQRHNPSRLYLCTATIVRNPMTVWAASKLFGRGWDFYEFRNVFYVRLPMPGREVWTQRKDDKTKDRLAKAVQSLGYTGQLSDYFDVPAQTYTTKYIELTEKQKKRIKELPLEYPDPIVLLGKKHQVENGILSGDEFNAPETFDNGKVDKILEYASEFPRMVVFAKYRAQIDEIQNALTNEGYKTLTLTGDTLDRGDVIKMANSMKECVFIAQAQVSSGWELPDFPVMIFASMSYSLVDRIQGEGRILRANALKKNLYITLVVKGGIDEAVFKAIEDKKDFQERIYLDL